MANIAIIGSGISGLGAASLLHPKHDITLYEKAATIGGHSRTLTVNYNGKMIPVDTGFIVFNYQNYPLLSALFNHLHVPVQKSLMTFGVSASNGDLEWGAQNPNALFGQRRNLLRPKFLRLLLDVLRFNRSAIATVERYQDLTLQGLLHKIGTSEWFARYYILPMGGAIWSCSLESMLQFPALSFVQFFKAHGLLTITRQPQWYTVIGGAKEYVGRLSAPFEHCIHTNSNITSVTRSNGKVQITDNTRMREFDQLIFACHADQALALLQDPSPEEKSVLSAFTYQKNHAVLHKDTSIMPKRKRCWSSWVYHEEDTAKNDTISVTYWMNLLQSIDHDTPLFVTLNPLKPIAPEHIFDEHEFEHPMYGKEVVLAQQRISSLQGKHNTWFCGAHLRNGFHEDGLWSAVNVAKALGADVPW